MEIIVPTKENFHRLIEAMIEIIEQYHFVSVGDFNDLVGLPSTYEDEKKGWSNVDNIETLETKDGYVIKMPLPIDRPPPQVRVTATVEVV